MLDAGVVSAILAVPPAIQAVRDLLRGGNPALAKQAEESLRDAEKNLKQFSDIGVFFLEAKGYHEKLTQIDLAMGELLEAIAIPFRLGGFDPDAFDREKIFGGWRRISTVKEFLPSLLFFLTSVRKIAPEPLVLDQNSEAAGGPEEFRFFAIHKNLINNAIRKYDPKSAACKEQLCDDIDNYSQHIRHQILSADGMIIETAKALGETLNDLRKQLPK